MGSVATPPPPVVRRDEGGARLPPDPTLLPRFYPRCATNVIYVLLTSAGYQVVVNFVVTTTTEPLKVDINLSTLLSLLPRMRDTRVLLMPVPAGALLD